MKIHEFQAKALLEAAGAVVPRGIVVTTAAAAEKAFDDQGGVPVVLKAQVHAGGRGKGRFKDSGKDFGGVKYLTDKAKVREVAEVMFKYPLVTKQTGDTGARSPRCWCRPRRTLPGKCTWAWWSIAPWGCRC